MIKEDLLQIDLTSIINKKDPKLLKKMPRFLFCFMERILHVKDINDFLKKKGHLEGLAFAEAILEHFKITLNVQGLENIPKESSKYIWSANHPLGGLDGIAFICMIGRIDWIGSKIKFPVNDIVLALKPLESILLPINKHGSQAKKNIELLNLAYASDNQILYFPAGSVSRRKWFSNKIADLKWHKSPIQKAFRYKRDIIPIHIDGKNSNMFYRIANWRKLFSLPNIEMLLLVNEVYRQKGKTFTIKIGEPIGYEKFNPKKSLLDYANWATKIKDIVYGLK